MFSTHRVGAYLEVLDEEGCRHFIRVNSIQILSDTDPLHNETLITAAGRTVRVPEALDEIASKVFDCSRQPRPDQNLGKAFAR